MIEARIQLRDGDTVRHYRIEIQRDGDEAFRFLEEFERKCGGPIPQLQRDRRWLELQVQKARA